ncbi:hypothetical protein [Neobacillus terrae]|uniref:hypothetical protein n=1 Tax=Neobacillus terrae TaxID=3034837 RepID=UPI00140D5A2A|nr:hypothetical protein [Neobacillus terrae]NHM32001.1 hypothetical protein [Neobacillus terrae]
MDKKELIKLILFVLIIFALFFIGFEIKRLVDVLDIRLENIDDTIGNLPNRLR